MKFLLDMPVSPQLVYVLQRYGHEGVHAQRIGLDRASDETLIETARRDDRIIITADLDFPRILALSMADGPGVILFRGGDYSDHEMAELLVKVLLGAPLDILSGSICVVDKKRVRITQLPLGLRRAP